ncbi:neurofilament heavy polypeptide-like [Phlebotomus argentipes]|uniref:neurofilament heavy polypeptide-like n=1 Tax=Phlebotomus argentipes TaxID=94469 RepID=UPI00289357E9|nr:neurofilament heavy polypeptide-like [Phlebotomus argentipes]
MIQIASPGSATPRPRFLNRSYEALDRAPRARSGLSASESIRHLDRPILRRRSSSGSSTRLPVRSRSSLQRGVVRVMSQSGMGSPSRIPRPRTSIGSSIDGLDSRRESSVSPQRRKSSIRRSGRRQSASSLLPAVTLLDAESIPRERSSRSPRRPGVLKVTPLSPIIGTPNKEPETQEDSKVMSPSRIPVRSNSISRPMARSNTTLGVSTASHKTQGSPLAASRDASPGKTPAKATSPKKAQKPPVKCHEPKKPVTKKPPVDKKAVTKTTRKIETVSKVRKPEVKPVSKTPSFRKDIANGTVKKEPASTRKEPSIAKKEPSSVRQETSSASKDSKGRVSRENSALSRTRVPPKLEKKQSFRAEKAPAKVMEQESVEI